MASCMDLQHVLEPPRICPSFYLPSDHKTAVQACFGSSLREFECELYKFDLILSFWVNLGFESRMFRTQVDLASYPSPKLVIINKLTEKSYDSI